ncbi:MAG: hypothetical protein V3U52_00890 [Thermoplasmata archaeon]
MVSFETVDAIVLLVVGFLLIQGLWLSSLTYLMFKRARRRDKLKAETRGLDDTLIEDVFLLHRSGMLIRHLTRRLKPQVDSDILTGMLRAVQEFVRDSFREESGELRDMVFGELSISICSGRHVVMATVIRGDRPADLLDQMNATLRDLERKHGDHLKDWDGRMESVHFVDEFLEKLLEGNYHLELDDRTHPLIPSE